MRAFLLTVSLVALTAGVGCDLLKTKPKSTEPTEKIDDRNTNFRPGDSAPRNALRAGQRVPQLNDFANMKLFIFAYELEHNKMPTIDEIKADLKNYPDARDVLKKIEDGVIILTGTKDKDGLWAYEVDADKAGGIVCVGNSVSRATADEVKKYLEKK